MIAAAAAAVVIFVDIFFFRDDDDDDEDNTEHAPARLRGFGTIIFTEDDEQRETTMKVLPLAIVIVVMVRVKSLCARLCVFVCLSVVALNEEKEEEKKVSRHKKKRTHVNLW